MNNIEVKISAKFASGAEITLSERQLAQATKLVEGIILYGVKSAAPSASTDAPKKRSRKGMVYRKWTPEEDAELNELTQRFPIRSHGRQHAIKQYASRTSRSVSSVEQRIFRNTNGKEAVAKEETPVAPHAFGNGFQHNFNPNRV